MFHQLFQVYLSLSKEYPAVIGAASLWALGAFSYFGRNIPQKALSLIKQRFYHSIVVNASLNHVTDTAATAFVNWISENLASGKIRSFSLGWDRQTEQTEFILGPGNYSFWYKRSFISVTVSVEKFEHASYPIIGLSTFSLSRKVFDEIKGAVIEDVRRPLPSSIYSLTQEYGHSNWALKTIIPQRSPESLVYSDQLLPKIIDDISTWLQQRSFYNKFAIPYKKAYVLEGPPGTGKTSLVASVATHFDWDIYTLNLHDVKSDSQLTDLVAGLAKKPKPKILLIEDFDSLASLYSRESEGSDEKKAVFGISLHGFLNCFGGVTPLANMVIFLTTNHLEKIDAAVFRPGRVDKVFHVGLVGEKEIVDYITYRYDPDKVKQFIENKNITFDNVRGCDLENAFLTSPYDLDGFISALTTTLKG